MADGLQSSDTLSHDGMPRNLSLDFFLGLWEIIKSKTAIFPCKFVQIFSKHSRLNVNTRGELCICVTDRDSQ